MIDHYTAEQRSGEDEFARRIEAAWPGRHLDPTTRHCPIDRFVTDERGGLVGVLEMKIRSCRSDQYPDAMIRADKVLAAMNWAQFLQVPAILAIRYRGDDVDMWMNLTRLTELTIRQDGVNDRGRGGPTAAHVHLPHEGFLPL